MSAHNNSRHGEVIRLRTLAGACIALACAAIGLIRVAAAAPPTGAISGVVNDGVTARPLAGAVVRLQWNDQDKSFANSTTTDSKGRFVFQQLPASNTYIIHVAKPGYTSSLGEAFPPGNGLLSAGTRIALADREWIDDVRIALFPPGAINGTVVDERGEPVIDVPVRALAQIAVAGQFQLVAGPVVRTDDRGVYRIPALPRGKYIVTVPSVQSVVPASTTIATLAGMTSSQLASNMAAGREPPNGAGIEVANWRLVIGNYATPPPTGSEVYPARFYPSASSVAEATAIDLKGGEDRQNIDFVLEPVSTVRISGRVTNSGSIPRELVLRLMAPGSENLGAGSESATALLAADGSFIFLSVPAGSYELVAKSNVTEFIRGTPVTGAVPATPGLVTSADGFRTFASGPPGVYLSSRDVTAVGGVFGRVHLDVSVDDITNVVVALHPGITISGQVIYDGTTRPTGLARVYAEPANGSAGSVIPRPLDSGSTPDAFVVAGLNDGEYFLRVDASKNIIVKSIAVGGADYTDRPFNTSSGADVPGVVVTLTDQVASLAGFVRDRQGALVRQAAVIAFPTDSRLWMHSGFSPTRIKRTAFFGNGAYRIAGLPKGDYWVVAVDVSLLDAWHDPQFFAAAVPSAARVTLDWGQERSCDLTLSHVVMK